MHDSEQWREWKEELVHFSTKAPDSGGGLWRPAIHRLTGDVEDMDIVGDSSDNDAYTTIMDIAREYDTNALIVKQACLDHNIKLECHNYRKMYPYDALAEILDSGEYPLDWMLKAEVISAAHISDETWKQLEARSLAPDGKRFSGKMFFSPDSIAVLIANAAILAQERAAERKKAAELRKRPPRERKPSKKYIPSRPSVYQLAEERGLIPATKLMELAQVSEGMMKRDAACGMLKVTERVGSVRYFGPAEVEAYLKLCAGYSLQRASRRLKCNIKTIRRWIAGGKLAVHRFGPHRVIIDREGVEELARIRARAKTRETA